ncbi:TonB-dependent receptor [Marivirga sp. S37H4]|uniref:TonB-dependent receptor n=1 Tax=Marivirga aurantiaca TaxID=2802615 RepID=A0A934WWX5_9BACT|nr:TonB-dependent receptor [Marivirga aurantiaca]MBK6264335.1 TonB-dependent receptor [Marivirga aurantiaca]
MIKSCIIKYNLLVIISFLTINMAFSQNTTVKGKVVDQATNEPLAYANVSLFDEQENLITGMVTPDDGTFQLQVPQGEYILRIQFVSYKTVSLPIDANKSVTDLGKMSLQEDVNQLSEVEVVAKKPQMEMKLDKRVFNVGEDLSNIGGSAESILDNLPSVTVDVEGNVSLRGSGNVRILINGRPSGLVGISGGSALRQIQADMIESIEVITNPSARYEAEGNAGIINIILKKDKKGGLNGSFSTNVGYPAIYGVNANLNYRKNKINIFGNYGVTYRENFGGGYIDQSFFPKDSTAYFTYVDRERERSGVSQNARFGIDYSFTDNTTLTGSFLYRVSDEDNISYNYYSDFDENRELYKKSVRIQEEKEDESVLEYDLNFTHKFSGDDDHKLTADFQYRNNSEQEDSDLYNRLYNLDREQYEDSIYQRSLIDEFSENIMAQANYTKPLGESRSLEVGWRSTLRTITNDYLVEQEQQDGSFENLTDFTNEFIYNEDIHALYAIYNSEFDKFTYQVGLRTELTDVRTELVTTDTVNTQNYLNLFPSLFLTYKFNKLNTLQASYSRRFDRPRFRELNPFSNFNDDRNIRIGNPNLQPEFTDSYEIGLLNNFKDATFYSGLYYRRTTGVTDRIQTVEYREIEGETVAVTIHKPQNLAERNSIGLENTYSHDLNDWWRLNANLNVFYSETYGEVEGKVFEAETFTMSSRATSQMTFWEDVSFQLSAFYRAPQQSTQGTRKAFYMIDLGLSKEILNKKGTIALNVRDLLNSRKWRSTTEGEDFFYDSEFQWRTRTFTLTFDYRLNSQKQKEGRGERGDNDFGGDEF